MQTGLSAGGSANVVAALRTTAGAAATAAASFVQPDLVGVTGAASTAISARFETKSLKADFGAAFDDVVDDTTAWTNAFNWLNGGQRRALHLAAGVSRVSSALPQLTQNNLALIGQGRFTSMIRNLITDGTPLISSGANDKLSFSGFTVLGNGVSGTGGNGHALAFYGTNADWASFLHFHDLGFSSLLGDALTWNGSATVSSLASTTLGGAAAIYVYGGLWCTFQQIEVQVCQHGIVLDGNTLSSGVTNKVMISHSIFDDCAHSGVYGKCVEGLHITGDSVFNNCGSGVVSGLASQGGLVLAAARGVEVAGANRFKVCNPTGIFAGGVGYGIHIQGCYCYLNTGGKFADIRSDNFGVAFEGNIVHALQGVAAATGIYYTTSSASSFIGMAPRFTSNQFLIESTGTFTNGILIESANSTNIVNPILEGNLFGNVIAPLGAAGLTNGIAFSTTSTGQILGARVDRNVFNAQGSGFITNGIVLSSLTKGSRLDRNHFLSGLTNNIVDSGVMTEVYDYLAGGTMQRFQKLAAAPGTIQDGELVYADGSGWNPGAGEGLYCRVAGAWHQL